MPSTSYSMITVARCDTGFLSEALTHLGTLCQDLKSGAGAAMTRYGVLATGDHAGHLVLLQGYDDISGIDRAFGVYGSSQAYSAIIGSGKVSVVLRNLLRSEDLGLGEQPSEAPAYGVLTRWTSADPMTERMKPVVPVFKENGAMAMRYYTIMTGSNAGHRLLAVGYPSMAAIEKTYDALRANADYTSFLQDVSLDFRNIVRVSG